MDKKDGVSFPLTSYDGRIPRCRYLSIGWNSDRTIYWKLKNKATKPALPQRSHEGTKSWLERRHRDMSPQSYAYISPWDGYLQKQWRAAWTVFRKFMGLRDKDWSSLLTRRQSPCNHASILGSYRPAFPQSHPTQMGTVAQTFFEGVVNKLLGGYILGIQKFLGQGSNPCHSSNQSHSSDNARSLTCYTTRELLELILCLKLAFMSDLGWDLRIRRFKEQRRNLRNKDLLWVSSLWPTMQSKFKRIVHMGKVKSGQPRAMRRPWYFWVWLHPTSEDTWPRARRGSQLDLQVKVELVSEWTEVLNEKCIKKREAQAGKGITWATSGCWSLLGRGLVFKESKQEKSLVFPETWGVGEIY